MLCSIWLQPDEPRNDAENEPLCTYSYSGGRMGNLLARVILLSVGGIVHAHVEMQIVPLFSQSLTIRIVNNVLNDARRHYDRYIVLGAIQISEFGKQVQRHYGDHVIYLTLWWRRYGGPIVSLSLKGGRQNADRVWINFRSRGYFKWACNFWTHIWQGGGHTWFGKVLSSSDLN